MSEWIKVDDRLPEYEGMYLCRFEDGDIETFYYFWGDEDGDGDSGHWGMCNCPITHWMPLPEPPEEAQ